MQVYASKCRQILRREEKGIRQKRKTDNDLSTIKDSDFIRFNYIILATYAEALYLYLMTFKSMIYKHTF